MIEQKTGNKMKVSFDKWRPSDQKVYISDISKVKKVLSWRPKITASAGIDKLVSWVKGNLSFFK